MTSKEMHIAVQQGLQRMGSYAFGDVLGEELDLQLNRMQERFVKQRFDKSLSDPLEFQQTQKRVDDLRTLIITIERDEVIAEADIDGSTNPFEVFVKTTVGNDWYITLPPEVVAWIGTPPAVGDADYDAWVINESADPEYMFLIDASVMVEASAACTAASAVPGATSTAILSPIRIVKREFLPRTLKHAFAKPTIDSLVGTIVDDRLYIHGDGILDVSAVQMNYIKVPRAIIYAGGYVDAEGADNTAAVDCELPDHTHNEIVDLTVQHMSALIQAPNYQQQVLETRQNE